MAFLVVGFSGGRYIVLREVFCWVTHHRANNWGGRDVFAGQMVFWERVAGMDGEVLR